MKVNVISILVVVLFTYLLTFNILIASQAGVILIILFGFIEYFQKLFSKKNLNKLTKKEKIELHINFGLLLTIVFCFTLYYTPFLKFYSSMHHMVQVYKKMPTTSIINAIEDIKKNPNDMKYCALLLLPSLDGDSKEAIAKYVALYYVGKKYCDQYGPWFENDCAYLESMNYSGSPMELEKNIKLCKIAKSKEFQTRLIQGGYQNGK